MSLDERVVIFGSLGLVGNQYLVMEIDEAKQWYVNSPEETGEPIDKQVMDEVCCILNIVIGYIMDVEDSNRGYMYECVLPDLCVEAYYEARDLLHRWCQHILAEGGGDAWVSREIVECLRRVGEKCEYIAKNSDVSCVV